MADRVPPTPKGLGKAGIALWTLMHGAQAAGAEFDERDIATLTVACRQADDIDRLEAALRGSGYTVKGSVGQDRLNPIVPELRQARLALQRLLGSIELLDESQRPMTATAKRAQRAAQVRWARRDELARRRRSA